MAPLYSAENVASESSRGQIKVKVNRIIGRCSVYILSKDREPIIDDRLGY